MYKIQTLKNTGILLILFTVILSGCSDNEIDSPLVGNWKGVRFTASEPVDENGDGNTHTDLKKEMDCVSMEAKFTGKGNFTITSTDATYDIQIVNGEVVLIPTGCSSIDETGKWSLNANDTLLFLEFKIQGKDEPTIVEVQIELSARSLLMKDLLFNDDGSITYSVEFEKH